MLEQNLEHASEAQARLVSQFQGKSNIATLLAAYSAQVQILEGVFFDLLGGRLDLEVLAQGTSSAVGPGFLDDSSGSLVPNSLERAFLEDANGVLYRIVSNTVSRIRLEANTTPAAGAYVVAKTSGTQLDRAGALLRVGREGRRDSDYRSSIRNQIRANVSQGTIEETIEIIKNTFGYLGGGPITVTEFYPDQLTIAGDGMRWDTAVNAEKAFALVISAKPAGVQLSFYYEIGAAPFFTFFGGVGGGFDNDAGTEPTAGRWIGVLQG